MATCVPSLFTALIHTELGAWNAVESALSEAGNALTLGRFLVLRTVRDTPACRIQEVAASQGITLGAASRLVDRLHRDGLLHRTPVRARPARDHPDGDGPGPGTPRGGLRDRR